MRRADNNEDAQTVILAFCSLAPVHLRRNIFRYLSEVQEYLSLNFYARCIREKAFLGETLTHSKSNNCSQLSQARNSDVNYKFSRISLDVTGISRASANQTFHRRLQPH